MEGALAMESRLAFAFGIHRVQHNAVLAATDSKNMARCLTSPFSGHGDRQPVCSLHNHSLTCSKPADEQDFYIDAYPLFPRSAELARWNIGEYARSAPR
jgi:hypothetical protein